MSQQEEPKFVNPAEMSYTEAVAELENILKMLQGDRCDIDSLAMYTRRASALLKECRGRLTATDAELRDILTTLTPAE